MVDAHSQYIYIYIYIYKAVHAPSQGRRMRLYARARACVRACVRTLHLKIRESKVPVSITSLQRCSL